VSTLSTRGQLPALLNERGLLGTGVEVGVKLGKFSELILREWEGRLLISVDPWQEAPEAEYADRSNLEQDSHDFFFEATQRRLAQFGERSQVWRLTSAEGAARVEPASADFVYIDARHDYESVREDLALWHPKVRPGGVLGGHDYIDGEIAAGSFGVKSAVDEFCAELALELTVTTDDEWPTWVVMIG
jgi:hypothetical protein